MSYCLARKAVTALLLCACLSVAAFAADVSQVIKNARDSYYTLKSQGLKTFKCDAQPDWQKILEKIDMHPVSATDPRLKKLAGLHYAVAVDEQGQATVTPYMVNGGPIDPSMDQMVSGMQQMLSGFYQTWTAMVITNPFPETYDGLKLRQEGDNFRVLVNDPTGTEILLDKNYTVTEMKMKLNDSTVLMFPKFDKTAKGFLLTSIDSDINNGQQKVTLTIQYQEMQGLQMPNLVQYKVTLPNDRIITADVAFSKYQITKQ
jgi:hypothetical protein